jgi:hypothetical protein
MAQMSPGANVNLTGLSPEFQRLLRSFSAEDFRAMQKHEPACDLEVDGGIDQETAPLVLHGKKGRQVPQETPGMVG